MSPLRVGQILVGGLAVIVVLACLTAGLLVMIEPTWLFVPARPPTATVIPVSWATPLPTFTATSVPPSPTVTPTNSLSPTPTPLSSMPTSTVAPTVSPTPSPIPSVLPTEPPPPADPPTPTQPAVDFIVYHQRMRTNEENSWDGKVANNCGGDHTIYVQVVDAAGQPLTGVIVGDTYHNVRAATGTAGPGKLQIQLWSNTMALEVQGNINGTAYTSEQTLPLSTKDEDIPAEWLFAGGYCESIANCQLRQQTNGLCRGHYSYDVVFQRTW
jgi:hypothetical protein